MRPPLSLVPSPALAMTADYLLDKIREEGGRAYRMSEERAFVLTDNEKLAAWLLDRGGRPYGNTDPKLSEGAYRRTRGNGKIEYDIWISTIPVSGPSVWEKLGGARPSTPPSTRSRARSPTGTSTPGSSTSAPPVSP
jgi:hypothetical protein